jgi:acyl transferase domain-containing protein/thioesterase domain-containing protein
MAQQRDSSPPPDTSIAVIGMAARFPGALDVREFWNNLVAGVESVTIAKAPKDHVAAAGVVDGIELFDAGLFGCTAGEAEEMDPQYRLFLECAWSALEAAGYAPRAKPLHAAVFGGASFSTYLLSHLLPAATGRGGRILDRLFGFASDFLATRVAYKLDLTGPAVTVQTGCSTSLVAVHFACQALLAGECDLALAGGAGLTLPQLAPYLYQEGGILSADGHCRTFDARSTGTVPGNGAGIVVLKRLADAVTDGDPIRAVVLGTAINNDGNSKAGFAAPSVDGQARAISDALAISGVSATDVSYIEAHGTATPLGDPIEIAALKQVFAGAPRASCGIGSVKTNIGHLDAAAGVAGFIKTVLALEHRVLPPSLHFASPNPLLEIEDSPFFVVSEGRAWRGAGPLRAGVSSFGIGGTNAHVVLQEPPVRHEQRARRRDEVIVVSARTPGSLERISEDLAAYLRGSDAPLADIAHTLQTGRVRFGARRYVVGSDNRAVSEALMRPSAARGPAELDRDELDDREAAFVFPGGGVQRVNMAAELLEEQRFSAAFDECAVVVRGLIGTDLRTTVFAGPDDLDARSRELASPLLSQVAIFACDWAIAQQWLAWGVVPNVLLGHSLGEYVAACLAGVFSLEAALRLVVARGRILERLPPSAMVSLLTGPEQAEPFIRGKLSIAAINGPRTCVVAGPELEVAALETTLAAEGIEFRRLRYSRASHSPLLDPHLGAFEELVAECAPKAPRIRVVSSVTGTWLTPVDATDPAYWRRQFREPVRFSDAISTLLSSGRRVVIEAGPGETLSALIRQHPAAASGAIVTTLPTSTPRRPLEAVGEAWLAGVPIDWQRFRDGEARCRIALPTYSFDRERHWVEAACADATMVRAPAQAPQQAPSATQVMIHPEPARTAAPARSHTERELVACFRELFRIDDIGIHDNFFALGGDSLLATRLMAFIARRCDTRLPLKAIAEAPTIAALAERIHGPASSTELGSSCLVRLQDGEGTPVFFVHAGGGHAMFYRDLARAIDPDRPMYGFESQGLDGREPLHGSIEDMASHYVELAHSIAPSGPYLLAGASLGGIIAYEMARQLSANGHAVPVCALLDAPGPSYFPEISADDAMVLAFYVGRLVAIRPEQLRALTPDAQLERVLEEARRAGVELPFSDVATGRQLMAVWKNNLEAMVRYSAPAWPDGEVQFYSAAERDERLPLHLELAWIGRCVVRVEVTPGDHHTMVMPPHSTTLAARIRDRIELAEQLPVGPAARGMVTSDRQVQTPPRALTRSSRR